MVGDERALCVARIASRAARMASSWAPEGLSEPYHASWLALVSDLGEESENLLHRTQKACTVFRTLYPFDSDHHWFHDIHDNRPFAHRWGTRIREHVS